MKKLSLIVIMVLAITVVFSSAYCFADETTALVNISDSASIDISEILSSFSEEYLAEHEDDEKVVIIEFNDESAHSVSADLQLLGIEATTRYTFSEIFNGESISIKIKDIYSLAQLSYIENVSLGQEYALLETTSTLSNGYSSSDAEETGIFKNNTAYQGDGMVVAIIDSSFDLSHVAFSSITSTNLALDVQDIADVLYELNSYEATGETVQTLYRSDKVPYAYDYCNLDNDVYSSEEHGTHVAGIVAGNCSEFTGVAPNAQLVLMKAAYDDGGFPDDAIAAALEDCIKLKVDVVNLSLGGIGGFSVDENRTIYKATQAAEDAGITVVCAAGNEATSATQSRTTSGLAESEYVDNSSIQSPASFESTLSIANAEETHWFVLNKGTANEREITYGKASNTEEIYDFTADALAYLSANSLGDSLTYKILVKDGEILQGSASDYEGIDVTGKIVVVKRGGETFAQKVKNAEAAGALGIIVVNNTVGTFTMKVETTSLLTCVISKDDGDALLDAADSNYEGEISFDDSYYKVTITASSSKGVTADLKLGIDVAGYGISIYSSVLDQSYGYLDGTSMAAPNVTGVFAVVKQYVKNNATAFGIDAQDSVKVAEIATKLIMSNATLLTDISGILISPRSQGAGLANIENALSTTYISCEDDTKTKIELGDKIENQITLSFTIENYSSSAKDYQLNVALLTELLEDGYLTGYEKVLSYTIDDVQNITISGDVYTVHVNANSNLNVSITLTLTNETIEYLNQFENGIYLEGYIILEGLNASTTSMSCPFIGFYGDWDSQDVLDITTYEVSDDNKAYLRASTTYGNYADSYYLPLGQFAYKVSDKYEGDSDILNEEFAALSIFSSSMYSIGYIQLGLLRSAEYIELSIIDTQTGETVWSENVSYVGKMLYMNAYGSVVGSEWSSSISPYALNLYNNEQYEFVVNVYRTYDKDSSENEISGTYSQKFYVDAESPEIEEIVASEEDGKMYATITMSDNHYIQGLGVCIGTGSSVTNVTLSLEDMYPVATEATGVGQDATIKIDVTDSIANASNGYLYFYVVDYAFNTNIYYYSIKNWDGESVNLNSKDSDSSTTSSSRPQTETQTSTTISFTSTDIEVFINKEVDLANTTYVNNYSVNGTYTWSVSDSSILALSNGKITGLQEGICVVTLKDSKNNEAKLIVKVVKAGTDYPSATYEKTTISGYEMVDTINSDLSSVFGISTSSSKIELAPGESFEFTYAYSPYNYNYIQNPIVITMTTTDSSIVSVDNNIIKANAQGEESVTVYANGVEIASYTIFVAPSVYVNSNGVLLACFSDSTTIDLSSSQYSNIIAIGANAFTYAQNAETIILPTSCVCIYAGTFKNNTKLTTIQNLQYVHTIQDSAFEGCTALTSVDLSSATSIGASAFKGCTMLSEVILDSQIVEYASIDTSAFVGCTKLTSFNISGDEKSNLVVNGELRYILNAQTILSDTSITSLGKGVFSNINVNLVDLSTTSITRIEAEAFAGNTTLSRIVLPTTLTYIGNNAFKGCTRLSAVEFKKAATEDRDLFIGSNAFESTSIQTIDLSKLRTTFGDYAFLSCSNLSYADVGIVQKMGKYTFAAAQRLMKVEYDEGSKDLGIYTFAYVTINSTTYYHKTLREVVVPSSIDTIGTALFAGCTTLSANKISFENIKEIGDYAFYACSNILSLELLSIEKLGYAAFAETGLQSITLNADMTSGTLSIGELAFYECGNLTSVVLPTNENVSVEILKGSFYHCTALADSETAATKKTSTSSRRPGSTTTTSSAKGINFDRVTLIGDYAFTEDTALVIVKLNACKEIGYAAFAECENITTFTMPVLEKLGAAALFNIGAKSFVLPETLKSIGQAAFANTSVELITDSSKDYSNSCIVIDKVGNNNVIYTKLTDGTLMLIYYPKAITQQTYEVLDNTSSIGEYAFIGNESLLAVTLPASLTSIGHGAFYGCSNLTSVTYKGTTLPKLLASYNSNASSLYCNFVGYDQDEVAIVLYVANDNMQKTFSANKTWSTLCDYILVSGETNNIVNFMLKYKEVGTTTVTELNKSDFEELKNLYEALTSEEKEALSNLTTGEVAVATYNTRLKEYNSLVSTNTSKIIVDLAQSSGLEEWVIITIIAIIGVALVAGVVVTIILVQKRKKNLHMVHSSDGKNIEDIFGQKKDDNIIRNEDVFRDYYKESNIENNKNEGTNDQDNKQEPFS